MVILFVLAGLAALAALAGMQWYAWRRLVRDTTAGPGFARRAGAVVFVAGPLLMFAAVASERAGAPFWLQQVLAWPGFMWMALSIYLVLALLVGELVRPFFLRRRTKPTPTEEPSTDVLSTEGHSTEEPPTEDPAPVRAEPATPSRRLFVSRIVGGTAAAVAVGTVGHGTYGVLRGPRVKRVTVPLAKLPRGAHGFRIAVVSDIHLGPILGRGFTQRVVDTINGTQPDLIAVVGDLVDGSVEDLGPAAAPLAQLRARHGTYFVTGNHEYFSGAEQWVDHVRELGLRPLENARTELPGFDLAGVDDVAGESEGHGPDFAKALGDRDRSRASVLLAHQPVVIHDAVKHGVDLQLSGHTHGGQLWPGNFIADLANPTLAGLERYGDTQLYVTRGAGAWGPPVRVGAPSDITVVELASRQA
ncbi:metallophosphoesterase [Streptomyces durmitorensis]|uniref:Metallophosphoesterase n=1 Tax=Streptomyces durmitorensis TaxID=319947 RepID=A0ABY4PV02_9ACTN|nr:metallophosphoesterase [Streptomyces durmitorensis]UQT56758.1 metallophosphoesterase [Streptomyces durmitorensis]